MTNQLTKSEQDAARIARLERELKQEQTARRLNQMNTSRALDVARRSRLGII